MTPILLDTIVVIVILLSIIIAFFRGFIKEILTIVNLAGAAAGAYFISPMLLPTFRHWFGITGEPGEKVKDIWGVVPPGVAATISAYAAVFFTVFIILSLAGMAISSGAKAMGLGPLDRGLGMVFGAVRGFLLVFLVYLPFGFFMQPEQLPSWAKESISVDVLHATYKAADARIKGIVPDDDDDKPVDPNSLRGKLKRMADDVIDKKDRVQENVTNEIHRQEDTRDILTDDEKR